MRKILNKERINQFSFSEHFERERNEDNRHEKSSYTHSESKSTTVNGQPVGALPSGGGQQTFHYANGELPHKCVHEGRRFLRILVWIIWSDKKFNSLIITLFVSGGVQNSQSQSSHQPSHVVPPSSFQNFKSSSYNTSSNTQNQTTRTLSPRPPLNVSYILLSIDKIREWCRKRKLSMLTNLFTDWSSNQSSHRQRSGDGHSQYWIQWEPGTYFCMDLWQDQLTNPFRFGISRSVMLFPLLIIIILHFLRRLILHHPSPFQEEDIDTLISHLSQQESKEDHRIQRMRDIRVRREIRMEEVIKLRPSLVVNRRVHRLFLRHGNQGIGERESSVV